MNGKKKLQYHWRMTSETKSLPLPLLRLAKSVGNVGDEWFAATEKSNYLYTSDRAE